jgi:type IV fimbrial biogenesis protein FimT
MKNNSINSGRNSASAGFTLIEMLVAMAIVGILLIIGIPSFVSFQRNSELTSATNSLIAAINAARGEAMKRGMNAMVVPSDGSTWKNGWTVFIDKNRNFVFDSTIDLTVFQQTALPGYFSVVGSGTADLAGSPYILFDASGYAKTKSAGFGALTISIARNDINDTTLLIQQTRRIVISVTGRVRACSPQIDITCIPAALE